MGQDQGRASVQDDADAGRSATGDDAALNGEPRATTPSSRRSRLGLIVQGGVTSAWDQAPRVSLPAGTPGRQRLARAIARRRHRPPRLIVARGQSAEVRVAVAEVAASDRPTPEARPLHLAGSGTSRRVSPQVRSLVVAGLQDLLAERGVPPVRRRLALRAVQLLLRRGISMRDDGSAFVITGDIPAMWLRDSAAQVAPLLALASRVPVSTDLVRAVLRTQVEQVLIDPRANAFNPDPSGVTIRRDFRPQSPWVFERKYAVDSLCAPLSLAWRIWRATGSLDHVDEGFQRAARVIVNLWRHEQQHDATSYVLLRRIARHGDSLSAGGHGSPVGRTGMTWSGFRPSDDACTYGYHVPANAFAAETLAQLADLLDLVGDHLLAADARLLGAEIRQGILTHAVVDLPEAGRGFAYEVDGLGHALLMDDANLPSLLSLPYLGFCDRSDPLYRATRAWVLSPRNPTWAEGRAVSGIGSSHTRPGWPWPLAILVEGLTAADHDELESSLRRAEATTRRDGLFHESVHADDPRRFSRRWFSWADMLHVELVLRSVGIVV
jgi:uncharacterized protein